MDPIKQAKAICNHGMDATMLQQQLAETRNRASGFESCISYNRQSGASTSFSDTGLAKHHTASSKGIYTCRIAIDGVTVQMV